MIETGECSFSEADSSNIPVNIWLEVNTIYEDYTEYNSNDDTETSGTTDEFKYTLRADNFCPRKRTAYEGTFRVYSNDLSELQDIIKNNILPLYQSAIKQLENMSNCKEPDDDTSLYYW